MKWMQEGRNPAVLDDTKSKQYLFKGGPIQAMGSLNSSAFPHMYFSGPLGKMGR